MVIIGIDQSYTRTGISIAQNGKIKKCFSVDLKKIKTKSEKRFYLFNLLLKLDKKYKPDFVLFERIRHFTFGKGKQFMSIDFIKSSGGLTSIIVDAFYPTPVYSVDTRSWKSQIVGTSKSKDGDKKYYTLEFVRNLGFDVDNDAADSACIALYGFLPEKIKKIKKEG